MPQEKIKLEELLKLKKAERPTQADWEMFDLHLRAKMFRHMVKKTPMEIIQENIGKICAGVSLASLLIVTALVLTQKAQTPQSANIEKNFATATPLPNISASYASNDMTVSDLESFVSAEISSNANNVKYVSNDIYSLDSNFSF